MTYLACLDDSYLFEDQAHIIEVKQCEDGRTAVILDRTIFYPQGGGQPADNGVIVSSNGSFSVSDVRLVDGTVFHYGTFVDGEFVAEEAVNISISKDRRMLNARLHSAGHLIDAAVIQAGLTFRPGKAYHFPDSPYVEYEGSLDSIDKEELINKIETGARRLVSENRPIKVTVADASQARELCGGELPTYVDRSRPIRVVTIGDAPGCPCAGTHLKELKEIGVLTISKIRTKADKIKVSYALD